MKRQLKPEDICMYLPYRMKFEVPIHEFHKGSPEEYRVLTMIESISLCLKHGKPILRPKKHLQRELESICADVYGSKDEIHLSKISNKGNQTIEWSNDNGNGLITASGSVQVYKRHELVLPHRMMKEVYKRKIDVEDLIRQNLAISTEDVKEKVYE